MKFTCWFLSGLIATLTGVTAVANAEPPFTSGTFKQICANAKGRHRIVLIDFYTSWCEPCRLLDRNTWTDPHVRHWLVKKAVCVRIDAEKETALASKYRIDAYPTILLLKPNGKEIDRLVGYRGPDVFLQEARQALSGRDSLARAQAMVDATGKYDPIARMEHAMTLEQKGRYAESLKEYLWCLDEGGKYDPAFNGVRLSFLLGYIHDLGTRYPQATDALKQRRNSARAALEKGTSDSEVAMEFAAYNENLGEQQQTLAVYDALKGKNPVVAETLFDDVWALLLRQRRYAELIANAGNVNDRVDRQIALCKDTQQDLGSNKQLRAYMKAQALEQSCGYYEALAGIDRVVEARAVRDKVLKLDDSAATYAMLVHHAARADRPAIVAELISLAKGALGPAELKKVEAASGGH